MIRSMTAYGAAETRVPAGVLRAEARTVNHRYFSPNIKTSRALDRFEPQIREWLRALLPRGHVNFTLRLERSVEDADAGGPRIDEVRARQYAQALRRLRESLGLTGDVDLGMLLRFNDIITWEEDPDAGSAVDAAEVRAVVEAAARATVTMREAEGARLAADLHDRLTEMERLLEAVEARAPERLPVERDRLRRVVTELLEGVALDEDRVAREIALLVERWDISEETVRLRSHIALFRETLEGAAEPVGKRLGFLIQEMNREINTIGSKANDAPIEHHVVSMKEEIERLREQVENVE